MVVVPFIAFGVILFANQLNGKDVTDLYGFAIWVVIAIIAFFYGQEKPVKTLVTVSVLATIAMLIGIFTTGITSVYAFMAGGLCCSVMWPCIFSLGVGGLGKYTSQGSAFLIMMILGGGIIPPIQGKMADYIQTKSDIVGYGIHQSYWIAVLCFAYLAVFGFAVKGILRKQGIDSETIADEDLASMETFPEGALDVTKNK